MQAKSGRGNISGH